MMPWLLILTAAAAVGLVAGVCAAARTARAGRHLTPRIVRYVHVDSTDWRITAGGPETDVTLGELIRAHHPTTGLPLTVIVVRVDSHNGWEGEEYSSYLRRRSRAV